VRRRPLGITIIAVLLFFNVAVYAVLAALSILDMQALTNALRALTPSGPGRRMCT
jgi:hypothetical protein